MLSGCIFNRECCILNNIKIKSTDFDNHLNYIILESTTNMKILNFFIFALLFVSCNEKTEKINVYENKSWESKKIKITNPDSLTNGSSYLSVYSDIYDMNENTRNLLTATVSIRNINSHDTVFIKKADYFDTEGNLIRSYIEQPIFVKPLETLEIVIHRADESGGSGANFIFEWAKKNNSNEPHFEAVMIWTTGTQGISFTTTGVHR